MKIIATWAVALSAGVVPMVAHAATYSAGLQLDNVLPQLRVGDAGADSRPQTLPGAWTDRGTPTATALARDQIGVQSNPVTGQSEPVWGAWEGQSDMGNTNPTFFTMGSRHGRAVQLENDAYGSAAVNDRSLGVSGTVEDGGGQFRGDASWSRGFSIDAFSSFTFAVLARVNIVDDTEPFDIQRGGLLDASRSFAAAVLSDSLGRARVELSATMGNLFGANLADVLSYSATPDGWLSLTVTNNTANVLSGSFAAGAWVDVSRATGLAVAAPVPEPESIAMLIAGLGLVGAAVRRGKARTPCESLAH